MKKIRFFVFGVILLTLAVSLLGSDGAAAGVLMAIAPPVVFDTQQIVFIRSLQEEYGKIDTWLDEAQDLSCFVVDGQTLRFPEGGAEPAVYVNRTSDIDSVEPSEAIYDVALNYYDSQNYKIRNIHLHALPYDKIAYYTQKSSEAIRKKEIADAAFAFAPQSSGSKRIILPTTGPARNGLKSLALKDVVTFARALDGASFPDLGRNLVLPSDMWWDLVENNDILKAQLSYQQSNGVVNPLIVEYYGFKIHKSTMGNLVSYDVTSSEKASQGAVISGNVVPAGFVFISTEVFRAGGAFEMFRTPRQNNPTGRADEFGFAHRFKADFNKSAQRYSAMIYQDKA
jgi:hypothetical protein